MVTPQFRGRMEVNGDTDSIRQTIAHFPKRYQHYYYSETHSYWRCKRIEHDRKLIMQLIDLDFEPTRGKVPSDAPFIYVDLMQQQEKVVISYTLKWQRWKCVLVGAILIGLLAVGVILIEKCLSNGELFLVAIWLALLIGFAGWLYRNLKHDIQTVKLFSYLIDRNK